MMLVGGGRFGGIHGAHMGPGVHMRYAAADKKRQNIPWVEYRNADTGVTRTYLASDAKPDSIRSLPFSRCNASIATTGRRTPSRFRTAPWTAPSPPASFPSSLPFVKKTGLELIKGDYQTEQEAEQKIAAGLASFYQQKYPEILAKRTDDIRNAGQALLAIYKRNVFPDLKVTWGTYPNNLGHADYPGCFRCHDDSHATADKKTITQDCGACHQALAVEETSPEILKTLGVAEKLQ